MNLTAAELTALPTAENLAKIHAEGIVLAFALATGYEPQPDELPNIFARLSKSILNSYLGYSSSLPEIEHWMQELYSKDVFHGIRTSRDQTIIAIERLEAAKLGGDNNV